MTNASPPITEPFQRIIVALDIPDRQKSLDLAKSLSGKVGMLKVGLESFVAHGPDFVRELRDLGHAIFLDLKLHDIPRTAAAAAQQTASLGVQLLTIHAMGGAEMVRAVRDAASPNTQIIAVTVLTSFDEASLSAVGFDHGIASTATRLGQLARQAGADGLVCSAHELQALQSFGGVRVVPGVRPMSDTPPAQASALSAARVSANTISHDDQRRIATPQQAVRDGATWIVVGRPVLQAPDPVHAVASIAGSLYDASQGLG